MAVSKRLRTEIFRRDDHTCQYCGRKAPEVPITIDHVVPEALGGTDDPTNLVTACKDCNAGKSSIAPDSALVAQVRDDAMRWKMAWTAAVAEATRDGQQRAKDIAKVKKNYVAAYRGRHGEAPYLPEGWEASVGRWLDLGLPLTLIDKAIASSVGRNKIARESRWNYFAGCCWSLLRELGDRTKQIAEAAEAAAETWEEKVERTVLDTAVLVWRDMYMSSQGRDPDAGIEDVVRKSAAEFYPDAVGPGEVIRAAYNAAENNYAVLDPFIDGSDTPVPFHIQLAKSYLRGWTHARIPVLNPIGRWRELLIQVVAARFAGYTDEAIHQAMFDAGAHKTDLIDSLGDAARSYDAHLETLADEDFVRDGDLTREQLDEFALQAWRERLRRRRAVEARKAAGTASDRDEVELSQSFVCPDGVE